VLGILRAHGLPEELIAVVAVESGFRPSVLSPKGARGLWQLMPETARRYGLAVGREADERLDPLKSTHAAARYLSDLYAQFADWPLALAAYNAGEQRVERALSRMGARDFWTLARHAALPKETRAYVPAVLSRAGSTLDREIRNSTEARNIVFAISSPAAN
jgi:membrane-bound lytic murein transglycosylase D